MRRVHSILVFLILLGACQEQPQTPPPPEPKGPPAVAAVVNDEAILRDEVLERLARRTRDRSLTPGERNRYLKSILEERIEESILDGALRDAGIQPSGQEIDAALDALRVELGGQEELEKYLEGHGMTPADLRGELRRDLGLAALLARDTPPITVPADAVERIHHIENGDDGASPEARFSMILLRLPPDAGAAVTARIHRDLLRIQKRIGGAMTFEEAAAQFSQDPSRAREGQWEFIALDRIEPLLRAAVETAAVGEITGPIRTADGWILLRVDGRRAEMDTEVAARKEAIRARIVAAQQKERREKYLKHLREEAKVDLAPDLK